MWCRNTYLMLCFSYQGIRGKSRCSTSLLRTTKMKTYFVISAVLFLLFSLFAMCLLVRAIPLPEVHEGSKHLELPEDLEACETVASIVGSAFFMNIGQQERGASEYLLLQSYRAALQKLIDYVKVNYPNSILGDVCLSATERADGVYQNNTSGNTTRILAQPFSKHTSSVLLPDVGSSRRVIRRPTSRISSFHPNTVDSSINDTQFGLPVGFDEVINSSSVTFQEEIYSNMGVQYSVNHVAELVPYKDSINLFYFPIYLLPEGDIPALEDSSKTEVLNIWGNVFTEMQKTSTLVSIDNISILPPTVEVFFDPFDEYVQDTFTMFSLPNSQISGDQLLYATSAIMLRAALAGVEEEKCLSLLTHTAAFIFNAIRSSRIEGRSIQISPTFLPIYDEAFRRWTSELDLSNAPIVEPYMVEEIYYDDLEPLLYFNASGNVNYVVKTENDAWAPSNLSQSLFDSDKLEELRAMALANISNWRTVRANSKSGGDFASIEVSARDDDCPLGYVLFVNPSVQPQTSEEECCAAVCEDLDLILNVGLTSMSECCVLCNLATCYVGGVDPLNGVVAIAIAQYGLLEERVISVTI